MTTPEATCFIDTEDKFGTNTITEQLFQAGSSSSDINN